MKRILLLFIIVLISLSGFSQQKWEVTEAESKKISHLIFDNDMQVQGQIMYENYCVSCHGTPGEANYTRMVPPPNDPAMEVFQNQSDGSLFYKITEGRNSMPGFSDVLSEEETWSVIAFMRSFNSSYVQPEFKLEGVYIPELKLELDFDFNVNKLVVKAFDGTKKCVDVSINAFIEGMFGDYSLGVQNTNEKGIAFFDVDHLMPGDEQGNLNFKVKAKKGYGYAKASGVFAGGAKTEVENILEGRHLWSTGKNAPIWLKVSFTLVVVGIWIAIVIIMFGLRKIKRLK